MIHIAWSEVYCHPLPLNHRFPMEKYELLPKQLLYEGTFQEENFFAPPPINMEDVLAVHSLDYITRLQQGKLTRKEEILTGFPWSEALVEREKIITSGSIEAAKYALTNGIAFNIAGGTHHAYHSHGEGFCLYNDIAVSSSHLLRNNLVKQVLVVDLDVHQGNGTAALMQNEPRVFTFSMHGEKNYPLRKEKSDLDIPLKDGTEDREYLSILSKTLPTLIEKVQPDIIIYQCGVDVIANDKLGRLGLSIEGCKQRDSIVLETAAEKQIPVMACMGGGYATDIKTIIEAHANTYRLAANIWH